MQIVSMRHDAAGGVSGLLCAALVRRNRFAAACPAITTVTATHAATKRARGSRDTSKTRDKNADGESLRDERTDVVAAAAARVGEGGVPQRLR